MRAIAILACAALAAHQEGSQAPAQEGTRLELVYEVDPELVRSLGWAPSDATDQAAVDAALAMLTRRLPFGEEATLRSSGQRILVGLEAPWTEAEAERASAAIASLGLLELLVVADTAQMTELGTDSTSERERLSTWALANPDVPIVNFNRVPEEDGGPNPGIAWFPQQPQTEAQEAAEYSEFDRATPVLVPADFGSTFGAALFERVHYTQDSSGFPAVGFELQDSVRAAFGEYTARNVNGFMAIVVHETIVSAPRIDERLPGGGIIRGRFTDAEVKELVAYLRTGDGPLRQVR